MTSYPWEVLVRDGHTPLPVSKQAATIQQAFPSYVVSVSLRHGDRPRFEAVTLDDSNPWCLISPDADEIRHELERSINV